MLVLDQGADPASVHRVRDYRRLVVSEAATIHAELPLQVARRVRKDLACCIFLEGTRGWVKLPAWFFSNADQLVLSRGAILKSKNGFKALTPRA